MTQRIFVAILSSLTIFTVTVSAPTTARSLIANSQSATMTSATDITDRTPQQWEQIDTDRETVVPGWSFRQPLELVVFVTIVACAWNANARKKQPLRQAKNLVDQNPSRPNAVSRETFDRATMLVRGDLQRIERLLNSVRIKHPERSEQWCWEKVIYDIERDRRRS